MRRLFDPADGWPIVSRGEFIGTVITAVLIVAALWAMTIYTIAVGTPPPTPRP